MFKTLLKNILFLLCLFESLYCLASKMPFSIIVKMSGFEKHLFVHLSVIIVLHCIALCFALYVYWNNSCLISYACRHLSTCLSTLCSHGVCMRWPPEARTRRNFAALFTNSSNPSTCSCHMRVKGSAPSHTHRWDTHTHTHTHTHKLVDFKMCTVLSDESPPPPPLPHQPRSK